MLIAWFLSEFSGELEELPSLDLDSNPYWNLSIYLFNNDSLILSTLIYLFISERIIWNLCNFFNAAEIIEKLNILKYENDGFLKIEIILLMIAENSCLSIAQKWTKSMDCLFTTINNKIRVAWTEIWSLQPSFNLSPKVRFLGFRRSEVLGF